MPMATETSFAPASLWKVTETDFILKDSIKPAPNFIILRVGFFFATMLVYVVQHILVVITFFAFKD